MGITKSGLIILHEKQKGKCAYCGCSLLSEAIDGRPPEVDHIVPKGKGGDNRIENLCLSCKWCNGVKRNRTKGEFLSYIQPYLDGKVAKKDLREYNQFKKLQRKFKGL